MHKKPEALALLKKSKKLLAAKGKKVVDVDLSETELGEDDLLKLVLGPTGNLRAPTLLIGKTMVVGFNEDMYDSVLN